MDDIVGEGGPKYLTAMLRHGGHLPHNVMVSAVSVESSVFVKDGVKGDKAVIDVEYSNLHTGAIVTSTPLPPTRFFIKFSLQKLGPMRLLMETTEVCRCEALFYTYVADRVRDIVPSPRCFFVDYATETGEFVLLSEVVAYCTDSSLLAPTHRIRDATTVLQQRAFILGGARLNARLWCGGGGGVGGGGGSGGASVGAGVADGGSTAALLDRLPRFDQTHTQMWLMCQGIARVGGLHHSLAGKLKGRDINPLFMGWTAPPGIVGREAELIGDMPGIMQSLFTRQSDMLAYGYRALLSLATHTGRSMLPCILAYGTLALLSLATHASRVPIHPPHTLSLLLLQSYAAPLVRQP